MSELSVSGWPGSLALKRFCQQLDLWIHEADNREALGRAAILLVREAHDSSTLPETLLKLIKGSCHWLSTGTDSSSWAESSDASRRYMKGLELLWTIYFDARLPADASAP